MMLISFYQCVDAFHTSIHLLFLQIITEDHFKPCSNYLQQLSQFSILYEANDVSFDKCRLNAIYSNSTVIDRHNHWLTLCFLELYYIKYFDASLNTGVKATKELQLF